jgi:hypothetical protein
MEDNSFDEKMKSVLQGYEDTTPSNLGWERFQGKYGQTVGITGVKRWMKLSAAANIVLAGTVIWLLWHVSHLQSRIATIEKGYAATKTTEKTNNDVSKTYEEKATKIAGSSAEAAESQRQKENANVLSLGAAAPTSRDITRQPVTNDHQMNEASLVPQTYVAISKKETTFKSFRISSFYRLNPILGVQPVNTHLAFVKVYGEPPAIVPAKAKVVEAHLPMQTVVALEKSKMGNRIGWAYGLTGGVGMASFGAGYQGIGIQKGVAVGALVHPLWGIESGVSFDQNLCRNKSLAICDGSSSLSSH